MFAGRGTAVFDTPGADGGPHGDISFAALHGLYWLALNLSAERPLALFVDDMQWADVPSLRALGYLARRLADTPVLLCATVRSTAPEAETAPLTEITQDPAAVIVRPGPLSERGVALLVGERLGAPAHPAFAMACRRTTGGNPFLLVQLLAALAEEGIAPDAASVHVVADVGPRAVSSGVLRRIGLVGGEAATVARALAVLGDGAGLPEVAALAGLEESAAATAVVALVRADVLHDQPPLRFVHPLVREAVYHAVPPGERDLLHARAAGALRSRKATVERVATQLLRTPTGRLPWATATLQEAAARAMARGAPDSAVPLLTRALAEPPTATQRGAVLRDLGMAEVLAGDPAGADHLAEAVEALRDPDERARLTHVLAETIMFAGDAPAGVALARRMRQRLPADLDDRRRELLAFELAAVFFGGADPVRLTELEPYRRRPVGATDADRMLASLAALQWSRTDGEAGACAALALEALGPDRLRANPLIAPGAAHVLVLAEHPQALAVLDGLLSDAHRQGSIIVLAGAWLFKGLGLLGRGDLDEAETALRNARDHYRRMGAGPVPRAYAGAFLSRTLLERGDREAAEQVLAETAEVPPATEGGRLWAEARLATLVAAGRNTEAVRAAEDLARHPLLASNPGASDRRTLHAIALRRLGRLEEARALALAELSLSRRWGAPAATARALRLLAAFDTERELEHLYEAVALLEGETARLEHAKTLAALGRVLSRQRADRRARDLATALELAGLCDAQGLARELEQELAHRGAPAVRAERVLSNSERRLLTLDSEGLNHRAIAQALFLTPHEVELALARAKAKRDTPEARHDKP